MTPKDNDELRQKIDDIVFRCFAQGQYWGSGLNKDPEAFDEDYRPENPIDRTEAVKAIEHLITTHTLRARIDERRQVYYVAHDILADTKIPRKEALKYFDERLAQLNHQKSQKEGKMAKVALRSAELTKKEPTSGR